MHEKDPAKRDLYVDGALYATLPFGLLMRQDLHVGDPFGEEEESALLLAAQMVPAREKAYQYLGYGDLSRKRLMEKLAQAGYASEVSEAVCDDLEERGYLDDTRLAARLAERFAAGKYWGPRRITAELIHRGIEPALARESVEALDFDYAASVFHWLDTKYRNTDLRDRKERSRAVQGLLRYGFDFDTVNAALSDYEDFDD